MQDTADSRSLDDHGDASGLQRVPYSHGDLLGQTLLNWGVEEHGVEFKKKSESELKPQSLSVCLLTLKPATENLHNPAETREKAGQ